jgi:hypothetical protein
MTAHRSRFLVVCSDIEPEKHRQRQRRQQQYPQKWQ